MSRIQEARAATGAVAASAAFVSSVFVLPHIAQSEAQIGFAIAILGMWAMGIAGLAPSLRQPTTTSAAR